MCFTVHMKLCERKPFSSNPAGVYLFKVNNRNIRTRCEICSVKVSNITAQKMKFYIKDFFSKCDQIRRELRIWSHLSQKSFMENFIFCAVHVQKYIRLYVKYMKALYENLLKSIQLLFFRR